MLYFSLASFDEMSAQLAARLKALRLAAGMQQIELAERAGVSRFVVQQLEAKGRCTLDSFLRVAYTLHREGELEGLFKVRITSIAEMEAAEQPKRLRAPRRAQAKGP